MKNIWLVCKKFRSSISDYSFSATFMKLFTFFKMAIWFQFSDNGFDDGGPYRVNQWTGFCMIGTSIMKELDLP